MIDGAIAGLAAGGAYALLAICAVVQYQVLRVVNFALAAIGAFAPFVASALIEDGWSKWPATLVGLLAATAISCALGVVVWRFFSAATDTYRATVSIAVQVMLVAVAFLLFGDKQRNLPNLASGSAFTLGGVVITWSAVVIVSLGVVVAIGVVALLRGTRLGVRLRAVSERPVTAQLHRIPAASLSLGVWAATGLIAAVTMTFVAPIWSSDFNTLSFLIVPGLAAALIGAFRSFTAALVGGLALGALGGMLTQVESLAAYRNVVPFLAIASILLWRERNAVWDETR